MYSSEQANIREQAFVLASSSPIGFSIIFRVAFTFLFCFLFLLFQCFTHIENILRVCAYDSKHTRTFAPTDCWTRCWKWFLLDSSRCFWETKKSIFPLSIIHHKLPQSLTLKNKRKEWLQSPERARDWLREKIRELVLEEEDIRGSFQQSGWGRNGIMSKHVSPLQGECNTKTADKNIDILHWMKKVRGQQQRRGSMWRQRPETSMIAWREV